MRIGRRKFLAGAGAVLFAPPAWAATMSLGGPAFGSYWRCLVPAGMDRAALMAAATSLIAELTSVVRNAAGEIVEGDPHEIKRQRDVWTFARGMGADDPNWQLVATGE